MTQGERNVWIAVYAAEWSRLRNRSDFNQNIELEIAYSASDSATDAVDALCLIAKNKNSERPVRSQAYLTGIIALEVLGSED